MPGAVYMIAHEESESLLSGVGTEMRMQTWVDTDCAHAAVKWYDEKMAEECLATVNKQLSSKGQSLATIVEFPL